MASKKFIFGIMLISLLTLVATGCSDDNDPVTSAPVDTAPPAAPVDLAGAYHTAFDAVLLTWGVNDVDRDLAGYMLNREHDGLTTALIDEPTMVQSFEDDGAAEGLNVYQIYAVDLAGNESAVASVSIVIGAERNGGNLSTR